MFGMYSMGDGGEAGECEGVVVEGGGEQGATAW